MKKKTLILILLLVLTLSIAGCRSNKPDTLDEPEEVVEEADKSLIKLEDMSKLYANPKQFKQRLVRGVGIISTIDRDENMYGIITNNKDNFNVIVLKFYSEDLNSPLLYKDDIIQFEGYVLDELDLDGQESPLIDAHYVEKIELDKFKTPDEEPVKEEPIEEEPEAEKEPQGPVTLFSGTWTVGEDIEASSYIITCKGLGNFTVYDNNDDLITAEILSDTERDHVVTKIKIDLKNNYKIELSGMQEVYFTQN